MGWDIKCNDKKCNGDWAKNIVDLLNNHRDENGWFKCCCEKQGFIKKEHQLQEKGEVWTPVIMGALRLGQEGDSYQPFVYIISDTQKHKEANQIQFCYYKDLRGEKGGRLKTGHGPGGTPVLKASQLPELINDLKKLGVQI